MVNEGILQVDETSISVHRWLGSRTEIGIRLQKVGDHDEVNELDGGRIEPEKTQDQGRPYSRYAKFRKDL